MHIMMNLLFINLGKIELTVILLLQLTLVVYAVFRVFNNEQGLAKILWVVICVFIPPLSIIYILYDVVASRKKRGEVDSASRGI